MASKNQEEYGALFDEWESWDYKVFENKHGEINDFLRRKDNVGRSRRTLNSYSLTLKKFYHEVFPELTPGETQVYHIEEYLSDLSERDLAQNTLRRYLESISAFFSWAVKRPRFENITGDPAAVVLEEIPKEKKPRPDCATWGNACKIVRNIDDPRDKTVAVLMAKTGVRVSEALGLKQENLLLEDGFIRFTERKGGTTTVNPVDAETVRCIQKCLAIDQTGSEYVFPTTYGNKLTRERIRRSVTGAAVDTGVMSEGEERFVKKFTSHTFRTVFTTEMRNNGVPDHITRYLRGDSDREVMDLYTRYDREDIKEQYLNAVKTMNL